MVLSSEYKTNLPRQSGHQFSRCQQTLFINANQQTNTKMPLAFVSYDSRQRHTQIHEDGMLLGSELLQKFLVGGVWRLLFIGQSVSQAVL